MNVIILGNMSDMQTGIYIYESFKKLNHKVEAIDTRLMLKDLGTTETQKEIFKELDDIKKFKPELILVLKGLELTYDTLVKIKEKYPKAKLVNWFFDVYLGDKPIWEQKGYFRTLSLYDYYFCSLKGVSDRLWEEGYKNVRYLDEACFPDLNGEVYMNSFQERKYGEDVTFVGTLGYLKQHPTRIPLLTKVADAGFNMKVWGDVICEWKYIPEELRQWHMKSSTINESHSMVSQSSKINLGIDQDINIEMGHSARLFRVLACGGFYLSTPTNGLHKMFKVNANGEPITEDQDLVLFYGDEDLVDKMDFLLEHDGLRNKIAKNGQKKVLQYHTFKKRIENMLGEIK